MRQHLRHYSKTTVAWRQQTRVWREQGYAITEGSLPEKELFFFCTDSGWQGGIELQDWIDRTLPQCGALASAAWKEGELEQLFVACARPLDALPEELAYTSVSKITTGSTEDRTLSIAIATPQGRVWLVRPPQKNLIQPAGQVNVCNLPLMLRLVIGYSTISCKLLNKVATGDILFVNRQINKLICENTVLGSFYRTEEGFMYEDFDEEGLMDDEYPVQELEPEEQTPRLMHRDKIKLNLEFVLQQERLTLEKVESLFEGQILPCRPEAEKNMIITVNGVAIARGELVWIEDRPGVEIIELYPEAKKDAGQ
ncbi:FliM/FliN family flagellar motor switch protein [Kalamiella sp. sgz302252]|uniref:FliM/FliN family flagellar motor switch protein n=1 Tax=Pantoea sp. sgz302252 TaxID=3341827 RepID=UPI0036D2CF73